MDDLLIRGAQVIDGSGSPGRVADVAVRDGRIAAVVETHGGRARRVVDASGLTLAPGFVDIHTHSDYTLAVNPRAESEIRQGVTTLVLGNCGFSAAPALPARVELLREYRGIRAALGRLDRPDQRERIRQEIEVDGLNNFGRIPSWDAVRIAISPRRPDNAGRTIGDLARERGCDGLETACDYLLADEGRTRILVESLDEADVREILRAPDVLVASDTFTTAPYGPTSAGKPHPRTYGTFVRVLGQYVRDERLLPLPQAIHKMTGGPARALGLVDRGLVREGYRADLALFDPATVAEQATVDDPHRYPTGVRMVIVNGVVVVDGGEHTGALPGRLLRRGPAGVG